MIIYLYCGKCSRGFAATLRNDEGSPKDHLDELLASDLKRIEYDRPYIGCAFDDCRGSLDEFSWWKDARSLGKEQGLTWPAVPDDGVKYKLKK
jgi:hypothetical protein